MGSTEDELMLDAAPQPGARKFSRLRKAGAVPKILPPPSPFDQNREPNETGPRELPTPAASPSSAWPAAEAAPEGKGAASQQGSEDERGTVAEAGAGFEDEEDELNEYYKEGKEAEGDNSATGSEEEEEEDRGGWESRSQGHSDAKEGSIGWGDVDADTQRVLRETASRDRLGQAAEVEVKPLSSILERIKQRQQAAIQRAPKPKLSNAPSFEEVFAAAQRDKAPPANIVNASSVQQQQPQPAACRGVEPPTAADPSPADEEAADLAAVGPDAGRQAYKEQAVPATHIVGDAAPAGMPVADGEQASPGQAVAPQSQQQLEAAPAEAAEMGEDDDDLEIVSQDASAGGAEAENLEMSYEEEVLLDDGYNSEEELPQATSENTTTAPFGSDALSDDSDEGEPTLDAPAGRKAKRQPRLKRLLLDMEAELSDEEGEHSEDEDDDDVDDQGELADLIGTAKETGADLRKREQLHRQWAEQRDAKELQQVLRGLKNGFRRRRGAGLMDDEDDEVAGRRRRARTEDENDADLALPGDDGVPWFQDAAGSDEDAEDLDLLKRAQQRHAMGESQQQEDPSSPTGGSIPLDEGSQEVLSLLARCSSQPTLPQLPPRSRLAPPGLMLGSEPAGGAGGGGSSRLARGSSFVGRQPTAQRHHSGSMAGIGSRSYVFGRDDSNSAVPPEKATQQVGSEPAPAGPTSFANLQQQLAEAGPSLPPRPGRGPAGGASLVSRLGGATRLPGKELLGSQGSDSGRALDAAKLDAVFATLAAPKRR
ncbi:hypothetical protein N2152v2_006059 [Parachlorella kessleri]